jgi:hypothetical protein
VASDVANDVANDIANDVANDVAKSLKGNSLKSSIMAFHVEEERLPSDAEYEVVAPPRGPSDGILFY